MKRIALLCIAGALGACSGSSAGSSSSGTTSSGAAASGASASSASSTTATSASSGTSSSSSGATSSSSGATSSSSGTTGSSSSSSTSSSGATSSSTSASSSSSGASSSTTGSSGTSGSSGGTAISAPSDQWTWVDFPSALCGNGSATGIGINPSSTGDDVLIYLEGGGACWSDLTCNTLMTAAYFNSGYGASEFATEAAQLLEPADGGFFDRTDSTNPFQDFNFVYVPYCSGDEFMGDAVQQFNSGPATFMGYENLGAFLARVVPTFPNATKVVLVGSSSGGFGAVFNAQRVQQAFGSIPVMVIDDSGTFMPPAVLAMGYGESQIRSAWNIAATEPARCTGCGADLDALWNFFATSYPNQRLSLLSYTQDSVLPAYFGITESEFTTGLDDELASSFAPNANFHSFTEDAGGHVLWFSPSLTVNGVSVKQFVTQQVTNDPSWTDVH